MRVVRWFGLFTLFGFAAGLLAAAPAGAQGSGSDVGGGHGAILSRTEGMIAPSGPVSPSSLESFWTSVQVVFGRHRLPIWTRARELGGANPACLQTRKRAAR